MKTKLKFEAFPEFVGKPMTELYEHLQKNYAGQLVKESDIKKEDIPKDGNWYYLFGSTFRDQDGNSYVPCVRWDGEMLDRYASWLEGGWDSSNRVVLLETEKDDKLDLESRVANLEGQMLSIKKFLII